MHFIQNGKMHEYENIFFILLSLCVYLSGCIIITGTLEQYDQAVQRCEAQLKRVNERRKEAS